MRDAERVTEMGGGSALHGGSREQTGSRNGVQSENALRIQALPLLTM